MKFSPFSLKAAAFLILVLFTAQWFVPAFVPPARALYWEDDTDFNAPKDRKTRPEGGFFLFKWIRSLKGQSSKRQAQGLEQNDKGPGVNGKKKAVVMITSGLVGLGVGVAIASSTTENRENRSRNNFIGASIGLVGGLAVGALIMPSDYQVDPTALGELKYRMALVDDPALRAMKNAFHASAVRATLTF
jgi:hypothetical protein